MARNISAGFSLLIDHRRQRKTHFGCRHQQNPGITGVV